MTSHVPLHQVHHCGRIQKCHGVGVVKADDIVIVIRRKWCVITIVVGLETTCACGFDVWLNSGHDLLSYGAMFSGCGLDRAFVKIW